MPKVFTATLGTETNTFSPLPTGLTSFAERMLWHPGEHPDHPTEQTAPLWACRRRARERGWEVVEGLCAFAAPAGVTTAGAYETLREEILGQLRRALPVDIVALGMHGAMVAEGYPDCEGDMLTRVREIVGRDVAVGVEIDPHGHLTEAMVRGATAIVAFKEYPHIDYLERAEELLDILEAAHRGSIRPHMTVFDCSMIGLYHTSSEPMRSFLKDVRAFEGEAGIHSISIIHSFPWADVPDLGTKVLVVASGDIDRSSQIAEQLGRQLYRLRGQTTPRYLSWDEALSQCATGRGRPTALADVADNPGGGAPGDATFGLRKILQRGLKRVAVGPFYDPIAVRIAFEAGPGSILNLRIGGKLGASSGDPIDVKAQVTALVGKASQTFVGQSEPLGDAACIHFDGIDVVLTSLRCQAFGPDLFSSVGVNPADRDLLVVKSAHHFHHGFHELCDPILYVAGEGALSMDFRRLQFKNVTRALWPLRRTPLDDSDK